ncbi:MAG: hypothetical protein PWQ25_384 [Deferribacteres bacterium]|jgi:hypothetical protein|nr:hypothetical protein [Deferribacteraceae bacterium]MDK2791521.1 hypothetical protein [Deferribacteres bacterium]
MSKGGIFVLIFCLLLNVLFILSLFVINLPKFETAVSSLKANVKLIGLPDISLVTEARFIRHRSLSDTYSIFDYSSESREVFPMSFVYDISDSYMSEKVILNENN